MKHSSPQITYYYKHREEILRKKREKYKMNPEIQKQRSKINYQKNRQKYIDYITGLSLIETGVKMTIKDKIISLSTCTYEYENARFVVHTKAVKIK